MIGIANNLFNAFTGFLQPLMNLNLAIYDAAALLQKLLKGPMALWNQLMRLLGAFGV